MLLPGTEATTSSAGTADFALSRFVQDGPGRWLGKPIAYAIGAPIMNVIGAVTTVMAPMILEPTAFGAFALLTVLFQNAMFFDLGLSQLGDKMLGANGIVTHAVIEDLVQARWPIAMAVASFLVPMAVIIALVDGHFTPMDGVLTVLAGLAMMIANGRVVAYRTQSRTGEFTVSALLLQAGLTLPRLIGLLVAGVTGCFSMLALWYGACAAILAKPQRIDRERIARSMKFVRAGLPFFAFGAAWIFYMTANRWFSSALSNHHDFGLFAFGANLCAIAITVLSSISQVRYPKIIVAFHRSSVEGSSLVGKDVVKLGAGLTVAVAAGVVLARPIIHAAFPEYDEAHAATIVLGASCIPLGIVAWLLPVVIAFSTKPVFHGARLFVPALLAMCIGMVAGNSTGGIVGQAWACVGASFLLVMMLFLHMRLIGLLETRVCSKLILSFAVLLAAIVGLAASTGGARAAPHPPMHRSVVPPAGWKLAFEDHFDRLSLRNGASGTWEPHYPWGARSNNDEHQYYVDPRPGRDHPELVALKPFRVADGKLHIRATPIPERLRGAAQKHTYASGILTTAKSFSMTYGYVEFRARVPSGRGLWPALWLLPVDQSWPPEIDVIEVLGDRTDRLWLTVFSRGWFGAKKTAQAVQTADLSRNFHTFGLKWTQTDITWFLDGREIARVPTPSDMHKPMYIIMNLAVGGSWAQAPDQGTRFPAEFVIDYVRAYTPPAAR